MKNVTISDVAKAAGVSVTTISRYLNGRFGKMSSETQDKIAGVIKQLNYHPSASARRMRTNRSKTIGVIVGDISNVFSSLLFSGIYKVLQPEDYSVLLLNANNSALEEQKGINRLLEQEVDGFIIQPSQSEYQNYQILTENKVPFVAVDRDFGKAPKSVGKVMTNNFEASQKLGLEFVKAGYKRIMMISSTTVNISAQIPRIQGFAKVGNQTNTEVVELNLAGKPADWLTDQLSRDFANPSGKTVIISLMGPLLFKTLSSLKKLQVTFPDQIGLASFDDWNWSEFVGQGIDLMEQNPEEIGRSAAKMLLRAMQNNGDVNLGTELVPAKRVSGNSF
jgi:LacI family kdg operon repressor